MAKWNADDADQPDQNRDLEQVGYPFDDNTNSSNSHAEIRKKNLTGS